MKIKNSSLYKKFIDKSLSLNEQMAVANSILANERTLLAWERTSFSFMVAGVTFIRFFNHTFTTILGWFFFPLGISVLLIGIYRYIRMKHLILELEIDFEKRTNPGDFDVD